MAPLRVLLVEDDPSVRRFVEIVLEPMGVDLLPCATLAEAKQRLVAETIPLVLTDLSLPDGSGLDLLLWMQTRPLPPGAVCRTVVFSGGVDPGMQRKLESLNVWRILHKPASVGALMACVSDTQASIDLGAQAAAAPAAAPDPVVEYFGGNRAFFEAYRQSCLQRFPEDVREGDAALLAGDAQALRRVAHNLKSVLTMLGAAQAAQCALSTEDAAAAGDSATLQQGWQQLRQHVQELVASHHAS